MKKYFLGVFFLWLIYCAGTSLKEESFAGEQKKGAGRAGVFYKKDVVPILKKYCLPCHTEDQMNPSELYLDTYENLMKGGKHGKALVVGKPDSSLMINKISLTPPFGDPMPMRRKTPFPQDTLEVIKNWIDHGAKNN